MMDRIDAVGEVIASFMQRDTLDHYRRERDAKVPLTDPSSTGHYAGCLAEAGEYIARLNLRGFDVVSLSVSEDVERRKNALRASDRRFDAAGVEIRRLRRELAEARTLPTEKRAPVQGYEAGIPWSLHLRAYDAYKVRWGAQPALLDLEGRHCRGGFGVRELDEFVPGWRQEASDITALRAEVERLRTKLAEVEAEEVAARESETRATACFGEANAGVAELEAALKPFAEYAEAHGHLDHAEGEIGEVYKEGFRTSISYRALRSARDLVASTARPQAQGDAPR